MSEQTPLTLRRKLFLAGKEAQAVAKNGHSDADGGFDFTRFNDVLAEASRVLEEQQVVIVPEAGDPKLVFGKKGCIATVPMVFEICDAESDETILKNWVGTGFDSPGHKAVYAAITGSEKYFLAKLLNIPFGIDPEEDAEPKDAASPEARQIAAEQDRSAEQPDERPNLHPVADPPSEPSIEAEIPADTAGLS